MTSGLFTIHVTTQSSSVTVRVCVFQSEMLVRYVTIELNLFDVDSRRLRLLSLICKKIELPVSETGMGSYNFRSFGLVWTIGGSLSCRRRVSCFRAGVGELSRILLPGDSQTKHARSVTFVMVN